MSDLDKHVDQEISAMAEVSQALSALDEQARSRVLHWAYQRFGGGSISDTQPLGTDPREHGGTERQVGDLDGGTYSDYHELIDATAPETGLDRILVTAYWFQHVEGLESFESFQINRELKNLGHPSANITRDMGKLIRRKPRLVLQVRKEGKTQQARKRYRLTREGIRAVERLLTGDQGEA